MKINKIKALLSKNIIVCISIPILYVGLYFILSSTGKYVSCQTGKHRYADGFPINDADVWQPTFLNFRQYYNLDGSKSIKANVGGYIFSPLIIIDRWLVHETYYYFEQEDK